MNYIKKVIVLLLIVASGAGGYFLTKDNSRKVLGEKSGQETPQLTKTAQPTPAYEKIIGDFLIINDEVCKENGKPVVYFFGSTSCPHCVWEKPIIQKVVKNFEGLIAYHENIDNQNDSEVYLKYQNINTGYIPFIVMGCKYVRLGSGESLGEEKEIEALTTILCKLTDSKPNSVCAPLKDNLSNIK